MVMVKAVAETLINDRSVHVILGCIIIFPVTLQLHSQTYKLTNATQ